MGGDARVLARTPLTFETEDGGREHAPLIVAAVGGVTTRLVLDTGSEVHVFTKELVDCLGSVFEEGEEGTDHGGETLPSWTVEDVALELGELELVLRDVVAIPAPPPFPRWGIGGILSPQHLHPSAYAVLDLAAKELVVVDGDDASLAEWLTARSPGLSLLRLDRDDAFPSVVVRAAIRPHAEIPTMLNTGGGATEFSSNAVPGVVAATEERVARGLSGADVMGAKAGEAVLLVADREFVVASLAVCGSMHDPQGIVGMDVLDGTILAACADRARPVFWQLPVCSASDEANVAL